MKKLLIIVVLSLWANLVFADSYKVLYVNDANLTYKDGRKVQKGDVISDASSIKWEKAKQAVKVINQSTKRQALFTGRNYVRPEGADALVYIRHASTQASGNSIHAKLYNTFRGQYELLDSIEVPTDLELSEDCYFTAAYMYGDTKIVNRLNYKDGDVIIDKSIFHVDDKVLEPRDVTLSIEYVNRKENKNVYVRDKIELLVIPETLE